MPNKHSRKRAPRQTTNAPKRAASPATRTGRPPVTPKTAGRAGPAETDSRPGPHASERQKIYVASSWRNPLQPAIVHVLRRLGHEVYDFRNPAEGDTGFSWREVMPAYVLGGKVTPIEYREALRHPIAEAGYASDIGALRWCDAVVYVMPCGRSASWEFGYAMGQGKAGFVVMFGDDEPDLMFSEAKILTSMSDVFDVFGEPGDSAL